MMRALYSGVSGLKTHQIKMDVIGNNIANVNTVAFKSSTATFSEIMYQNLSGASGATGTRGGVNGKQIGLGVTTGATSVNITSPGATQTTGDGWDLKITGDSFFVVNNGTENLFTKAGGFYIDGSGNLATKANGYNVMGWQVDPATGAIRKDTVSALKIMQEKNMTSPPEATTKATVGGIIDSNNVQVNSANGYNMNLNFYDALGYSYTAKFAVKTVNADTKTYTVELADILDANDNSILDDYLAIPGNTLDDIFGIAATNTTNYTMKNGFSYAAGVYSYDDGSGTAGFPVAMTGPTAGVCTYNDPTTGLPVNVSVTTMFEGPGGIALTDQQALEFGTNGGTIAANGEYSITATTYTYEMDFNEVGTAGVAGAFNYIGAPGAGTGDSVLLKLGALGGQFANIDVNFAQSKCYDNKKSCTMDMAAGQIDANENIAGSGKRLGAMNGLAVQENGQIFASYDNGNTVLLAQIAVASFANAAGLEKIGDNCYRTTLNSGDFDGIGQEVTADGGKMNSGVLEMSNVDLSNEFTEMITTQRGFQANSRIITTSDTLLEELINLKR